MIGAPIPRRKVVGFEPDVVEHSPRPRQPYGHYVRGRRPGGESPNRRRHFNYSGRGRSSNQKRVA